MYEDLEELEKKAKEAESKAKEAVDNYEEKVKELEETPVQKPEPITNLDDAIDYGNSIISKRRNQEDS